MNRHRRRLQCVIVDSDVATIVWSSPARKIASIRPERIETISEREKRRVDDVA